MSSETCPRAEELTAFALGTLPEPQLERIARHLDACCVCEEAVNLLDRLSDPLLTGLRRTPLPGASGASSSSKI
jgi:anti-sigma factor RsiW